jgi:hypothetical protein
MSVTVGSYTCVEHSITRNVWCSYSYCVSSGKQASYVTLGGLYLTKKNIDFTLETLEHVSTVLLFLCSSRLYFLCNLRTMKPYFFFTTP